MGSEDVTQKGRPPVAPEQVAVVVSPVRAALAMLVTNFARALHDLVTSKKFLTAVLTFVASVLVKDAAHRQQVIEVGLVLIGAQGAADFGKGAKANAPAISELVPGTLSGMAPDKPPVADPR